MLTSTPRSQTHYPLTSPQREIWFDQLLHEGIPLYNIGGFVKIPGLIDPILFEQAINLLIQKHDALRTILIEKVDEGGLPLQTFVETLPISVLVQDFSGKADAEQLALTWMQQRFNQPFELLGQPLFRYDLVKTYEDCYYWLMQYHHLIADGYSIALLHRSLANLYSQLAQGQIPDLTSSSYTHYIRDDRNYVESNQFEQQRRYWLEQYPTIPEPLLKPRYRSQFTDPLIGSGCEAFFLSRDVYQQLNDLAKQQQVTFLHVMLGVLYVYFTRIAQRDELVLGLPVLNRANTQFKQTAGLFVEISPAWFQFGQHLNFSELIVKIRQLLKSHYRYQRFPISELNREAGLDKTGRSALFDINLSYQNFDYDTEFYGIKSHFTVLWPIWEQAPLIVHVQNFHRQSDVKLDFVFNLAYFTPVEIQALQSRLMTIVQAVLAEPAISIRRLPILTEQEIYQLKTWNQTQTDYPKDQTIVTLFEQQVAKTPDNIAVVFEGQELNYRELNEKANQLAHYLLVHPALQDIHNPLIAICVERSLEMVIGLLGILKAGGAYVPIDPNYPRERVSYLLQDSAAPLVLMQSGLTTQLPLMPTEMVCLDEMDWTAQLTRNPIRQSQSNDLAYVIYTSGSTGQPKGVMIEHHSLNHLIHWHLRAFAIQSHDKATLFANNAFDASVWELWPYLAAGACVYPSDSTLLSSTAHLLNWFNQHQITVSFLPTPIIDNWHFSSTIPVLMSLRLLLTGGDNLHQCPEHLPCTLVNNYGPTENTVVTTSTPVTPNHKPTIGKPINDVSVFILDKHHQILPPGISGELCIAGEGLARGYLNRPKLTAEKFIEVDLFGKPERIYKTGDLARWFPDGNLEFLGRIDHQVKLRGYRIELGEIETVLSQHDAINEVVVALYQHDGNKSLAAYLTLQQSVEIQTIREALKTRLPDYMIPASFTVLNQLPLTPNGKVDRNALPDPEFAQGSDDNIMPRSDVETLLASLWSSVLKVEVNSVSANFFNLGGHSLLATQLASRIRDNFEIEMPLQVLFKHPVLSELANWLEQQQCGDTLPPIAPQPQEVALCLSYAQQRLWFLDQLENSASATYNMPYAFQLNGQLNQSALQQTFRKLVERHQSLRLCFPQVDGKPVVKIIPTYDPLTIIDLSSLAVDKQPFEIQRLSQAHAARPFNLAQGPLLRFQLLQLQEQEHILLFNMHHIISDGWSMNILMREWIAFYTALSQGREVELEPLAIQYTDYAVWQRNWLQGELLQRQLDYWCAQLANAPQRLELPTDFLRPAMQSYHGAHLTIQIDNDLTQQLHALSRQQGCTLFMTLLTAFNVLLYRYSGQNDLLIGSPIANRTHSQTENLIGFFVNNLVLRTHISNPIRFSDLLNQVRHTALEAYAHQDIPFEHLVKHLKLERSLSYSPLFQVMFAWQNNAVTVLDLPELNTQYLFLELPVSLFDLTLSANESNGHLILEWEYATDLFSNKQIQTMANHFATLLANIVQQPDAEIHRLSLLTTVEIQQVIEWSQTETIYPQPQTVVTWFDRQVTQTPDNIAVVFEDERLTYQQLNEKANQLAHELLSYPVLQDASNPLLALYVERSLDMLIGLLGIFKAGGAYVPIDPNYPAERIAYLLNDSAATVLLTQSGLQTQLPATQATIICLDKIDYSTQSCQNLAQLIQPHDLAYVIYTSGSTGTPKGVMVEHHALFLHLYAMQRTYAIEASDCVLQFASMGFDTSLEQVLVTWLSGACLVPVKNNVISTHDLLNLMQSQKINIADLPPTYWQQMLDIDIRQVILPDLHTLILGGEALPWELAQRTRDRFPALNCFNAYGPTEAVITATLYRFPATLTGHPAYVSIGQPRFNTQVLVLDDYQQLQPIGIPGELYIAGESLARGYRNDPKLTTEQFIEIELLGSTRRLYKTGDRVRWLPEGNLEFLGRLDDQVKLRGFRIELGEIEKVLTQHKYIKETVVIRYESSNNPTLAAYVTMVNKKLAIENDQLVIELRDYLKNRLPDYMLPASLTVLDKLPLTANGKIDRSALPEPIGPTCVAEYVAPRTPEEELLVGIWSLVLNIDKIGIHDNFFRLGGNSLQAVQLTSKITLATNINMPVKQLFLYPTIAQLAPLLTNTVFQRNSIEPNHPASQLVNQPISVGELVMSQSSSHFQLEKRSLLSLLLTKKIQPVDVAALGYLPNSFLEQTDLSREEILEQWFDNLPIISNIIETAWGRIAVLLLPRFDFELYGNMDDIVGVTLDALEMAGQIGATIVSLTGIIPSATDYGRAIVKGMANRDLPQITTGHSTTSATVVLTIQKILQESGREMPKERVGVIGLGSIGFSSLCLMLKCLPHPVELILCDLYCKKSSLENIRNQLVRELGFRGKIQLLFSETGLPDEIYNTTLIIGATNVPDVLDINQVQSGTLIVDDSGPHCFKYELAIKRFQEHQDILFTEGGVLKSPQIFSERMYFPHYWEKNFSSNLIEKLVKHNSFEITGCVFSSVLSSYKKLKPTVGLTQLDNSVEHYETLLSMGFQAADLHCEDYVLPDEAIRHFRGRFGY